MNNKNKRRAARDRHDSVVEILDGSGKLLDTGRLVDISDVGAALRTASPLAVDGQVRLRLRLIEKGVLEVTGTVVWERRADPLKLFGVRFDSVNKVHPTGELKKPGSAY